MTPELAPAYRYRLGGLTPYAAATELQLDLAAARSQQAIPDVLVLVEHEPVITLGPRTDAAAEVPDREALQARGIDVVETSRGGRATYHGPGQLVAYPIVDLTRLGRDLRGYVATLQDAVVATLAAFGVEAAPREGREFVGVWVGERKIASIGVQVSGWITSHGVALNLTRGGRGPVLAVHAVRARRPRGHEHGAGDRPRARRSTRSPTCCRRSSPSASALVLDDLPVGAPA